MRVVAFLGKLCNVRSGEWPRLSLLYCMSLSVLIGLTWLDAIISAAFLQRVGVQYLPWVFISSAACSLVALFVYTGFADWVSNTKLLIVILAIGGAGLLFGLALVAAQLVWPGYLILYLALNVPLWNLYSVHWATFVNQFYDIRAAKRIVPVLGTASRLAGVIGGLSIPVLNRLLSPSAIILLGVGTLVVMAILAAAMPHLLHERRANLSVAAPLAQAPAGRTAVLPAAGMRIRPENFVRAYGANLREGYQQVVHSPFLRSMALSALSMTLLMALLNYCSSAILQAELKTTVQISNFVGILSGVANLAVLPIQLFLLSRLIIRVGLRNARLAYPVIGLIMAGSMVVAPGLPAAGLVCLDRAALRTAFYYPIDNLLYNAVPPSVKARARAFVSGLLAPLGTILAGLLLLTPLTRTWFLPAVIIMLALAFVLAALLVRGNYGQALMALLEREDVSSLALQAPSFDAPAMLPAADAATLAGLAGKLRASASPERALFVARLLLEIGGEAGAAIVGHAARTTTDVRLRASLLNLLTAADLRGGSVRELYSDLLSDGDGHVRLAAIGGLELIDGPHDERYLKLAGRLLADPEVAVRLHVLPALLTASEPGCRSAGSAELRALLSTPDPHTRASAVRVVGQARATAFLPELVPSLADRADEVRLAAALAAEELAGDDLRPGNREMLLAFVIALLYEPIERARAAAIAILGRLSQDNVPAGTVARGALAASLADPSQTLREQVVESLSRCGRRALAQLQEQLGSADPQLRKMATLVLARIEPRKYAPLISGPVFNADLLAIYQNLACLQALAGCPGSSPSVLGRVLRERNTALLNEALYLLRSVHDPAAVETIVHSLFSPQVTIRADATEALESLTTPQTAALLAPLFEPELPSEQLRSLLKSSWDLSVPTAAAALHSLLCDAGDIWLRMLGAASVAELHTAGDLLSEPEIGELMGLARADPDPGVCAEVDPAAGPGAVSLVARVILLQEVPFFQNLTVDQVKWLASACDEQRLPAGRFFFDEGDAGGALYLVAGGQVAIEQGTQAGTRARLSVVGARSCFGESELFDDAPRSSAAVALEDTLALRLRREPLVELAGRQPDIYVALIGVLARRLREANDQIGALVRSRPRQLHRLFDSFEEPDT